MSKRSITETSSSLEKSYPTITRWIKSDGWIDIGQDDYRRSMVRVLDEGGLVWEGKTRYATLDELLLDLETGLANWMQENG
jgi:hypothetical protein